MVKALFLVLFIFGCSGAQMRVKYNSEVTYPGELPDLAELVMLGDYEPPDFNTAGMIASAKCSGAPQELRGHTKFFLVAFDRPITRDDAAEAIQGAGMRLANLRELLVFGSSHWALPRGVGNRIIAFGSSCREREEEGYPAISRYESEYRSLQILYEPEEDYEWPTSTWFLAVQK